jgi:hypothetical protein
LAREIGGLEAAQQYLAHVGTSVCERHYTRPVQSKLDEALAQMGKISDGIDKAKNLDTIPGHLA